MYMLIAHLFDGLATPDEGVYGKELHKWPTNHFEGPNIMSWTSSDDLASDQLQRPDALHCLPSSLSGGTQDRILHQN